jgi:hypothetical protein
MRALLVAGIVSMGVLGIALSASAMRCNEWARLDPTQQSNAIVGMIDARLEGERGKKYTSVNRPKIRRCLMGRIADIQDEFDAECGKRNRRRLDDVLTSYIVSCVD